MYRAEKNKAKMSKSCQRPFQLVPEYKKLFFELLVISIIIIIITIYLFGLSAYLSNTGQARLIRSHSLARFCFELSRNLN